MPAQFNTLCQEATLLAAWNAVKSKGSVGGIDGITIQEFDKQKHNQIVSLINELKAGTWKPQPYLEIEVPKNKHPDEVRKLGMTAIRDKIVQQAIRAIIEPRYERIFVGNSYGYRPGKGATRAIKRILAECRNKKYKYVLRLDVDNYFDTIDHFLLRRRLVATGTDEEIVRLIMLSIEMGKVKQNTREWVESELGTPQGAILSPLLSNLYLHSFDQFAVSRGVPYIRYADDFLFLCETKEQAQEILNKTEKHLREKLKLELNQPTTITNLADGFDFLGVTIKDYQVTITAKKREDLCQRILSLEVDTDGLTSKSSKTWAGFSNYYAQLLPEDDLESFDAYLMMRLEAIVKEQKDLFSSKAKLQMALSTIPFLSKQYKKKRSFFISELLAEYAISKSEEKQLAGQKKNQKLINERKNEFRRKEAEGSGLLVDKPGTFIGLTNRGVTVSYKGKVISQQLSENLSQIVITGNGVSLSSNLMGYCMSHKIPIDLFDHQGTHLGSFMSSRWMENSLWAKQADADASLRNSIALGIIEGKIKNQYGLLKYFHKYHKQRFPALQQKIEAVELKFNAFSEFKKSMPIDSDEFIQKLMGHEAQVAIFYWDYIRELVVDDNIGFDKREHKGATDLMNSMLNYGYAILYVRVWQALLAAHLNPYDSVIHAKQAGKPTLVYDLVEIFRSQVVDRVVISLIQKGQELAVRNGLLTDQTRQLLVKAVMERLARYEKWQGEEMKMEQIIQRQAKMLAQAYDSRKKFKPYVAKW